PTDVGVEYPIDFGVAQQGVVDKSAVEIIDRFETAAEKAGVEYASEIVTCNVARAPARLAYHARHADITFMGQPDPEEEDTGFHETLLDGVLFASGRPVYTVPYIGRPNMKIRKAVIAWDGGKKAARALNDALPLLKDRAEVIVLVVNPEERASAHGENPGADIAAHLERHGIKTSIDRQYFSDLSAGTVILNYLTEAGADLLVMGAYGHSRLRERAFGGVTNTIMNQMTVPVLMSE
ncbi:MAG: universal stress protein, partial [Rhizobiaceae bacterium]|nr:universal stress protein [Rhizobiaceae bacterium]